MGVHIDWEVHGMNGNGTYLSGNERDLVNDAIEHYNPDGIETAGSYLASFYTTSFNASRDIEEALTQLSANHPSFIFEVKHKADVDDCPSRIIINNGNACCEEGTIVYGDDSELDLFSQLCFNLPIMHGISTFWSNGDCILCKDQSKLNVITEFLEDTGYKALTGYCDPDGGKASGEIDSCTGNYYVTV